MVALSLPYPVSTNRIWRHSKGRTHSSPEYAKWRDEALGMYQEQKRELGTPVVGHFTYHIVLNEKKRHGNADGDNRTKCVLDFLEKVGLIENDKYADGGSWSWGPLDETQGCFVQVWQKGVRA